MIDALIMLLLCYFFKYHLLKSMLLFDLLWNLMSGKLIAFFWFYMNCQERLLQLSLQLSACSFMLRLFLSFHDTVRKYATDAIGLCFRLEALRCMCGGTYLLQLLKFPLFLQMPCLFKHRQFQANQCLN